MQSRARTRVKICGLTRESDIETAVSAGADAVGVICDVPVETPREVAIERAGELLASVPPFVTSVLVTMPNTPERAIELAEALEPDAVQIHHSLSPDELAVVREETSVRLLTGVDAADIEDIERYDDVVDALVVDSVDADGAGGTGETHDWKRTRANTTTLESPVILAGGLTPENVAEAVRTVEPFAVDVSSGVERSSEASPDDLDATTDPDGPSKDPAAIRAFVDRATQSVESTAHCENDSEPTTRY